jgi:hypothetical protein
MILRAEKLNFEQKTRFWCEPDWILSPARLPIPPLRHLILIKKWNFYHPPTKNIRTFISNFFQLLV